jgi:glycyl-tRNA synthetase
VLSMQDAVLRLMSYWTGQGCVLAQPYNVEVGAGTLNPATSLRVLGPEPWKAAYVEPSVRPDDSRYGENPNRMQTHTQFQVILKPDPGNPQELYLDSLKALGIDTGAHDVRFVEDNWESPALGAWGLGWEVWLDGLEITQFTYFQQSGGLSLDPVSVEITYGLERILMALQKVTHFKDLKFTDDVPYGEIVGQAEFELSTYYLDEADVEVHRQLFETYEAQAERLVEQGLALPAHNYVLRCSHAFNVLDSRGAVGATERARAFARVRSLAHRVAKLWVAKREEVAFPLGQSAPPAAPEAVEDGEAPVGPAPLLVEIGSEELPADAVDAGLEQLRINLDAALVEAGLAHGAVDVVGTPRRLVALVDGVAPRQPDRSEKVRGPKAEIAFDADGNPTKAGAGFARKMGIDPSELAREEQDDAVYVVAERHITGRSARDVLAELLPGIIGSINFDRTMRWGAGPTAYSRPVRWVTALLGDAVVPFTYADLASGRTTRALRDDPQGRVALPDADSYRGALAGKGIMVDGADRRRVVTEGASRLAAEVGGTVDLDGEASLVDEVVNLIEAPVPVLGAFDADYLRLPDEVLTTVMRKHQRYLPVRAADGTLMPYFVTVGNGPIDEDVVREGNEAVVRARFADAAFFFERDCAHQLEEFLPALERLTFEERAGSMLARAERIEHLATWLGEVVGQRHGLGADGQPLDVQGLAWLARAAHLAKADLTTEMVVEMSSLAGVMGREYALRNGEPAEVAEAIFEHTLPRFAGDALPGSWRGALLAVADRSDALVALFAVGAQPTGRSDPYALRRAASGLVQILIRHDVQLGLRELFGAAADRLDMAVGDETLAEVRTFTLDRLGQRLADDGHRRELVQAVLSRADSPADAVRTLDHLEQVATTESFQAAGAAFRRAARIARGADPGPVDPAHFEADAEKDLWDAYQAVADELDLSATLATYLEHFAGLVEPINELFDAVLINAESEDIRRNRHRLLLAVTRSGEELLDWDAVPEL